MSVQNKSVNLIYIPDVRKRQLSDNYAVLLVVRMIFTDLLSTDLYLYKSCFVYLNIQTRHLISNFNLICIFDFFLSQGKSVKNKK